MDIVTDPTRPDPTRVAVRPHWAHVAIIVIWATCSLLVLALLVIPRGNANPPLSAPRVPSAYDHTTTARAVAVDTVNRAYVVRSRGLLANGRMSRVAAEYSCTNRTDRADHLFNAQYAGGFGIWRPVYAQFTLGYRWCVPIPSPSTRLQFAENNYSLGAYDVEETTRINCGAFDRFLDSVNFNMRAWRPSTGAEHNPGQFKVPCDSTSSNSEIQDYDYANVPRLYRDQDGDMPKWDLQVVVDVNQLGYPGVPNKTWDMTSRTYNP